MWFKTWGLELFGGFVCFFSVLQSSVLFFLAVLGFRGWVGFSPGADSEGYSPGAEQRWRARELQQLRLPGSRAQARGLRWAGSVAPRGTWDPGTHPVSPALAGRLCTTGPPGKPWGLELLRPFCCFYKRSDCRRKWWRKQWRQDSPGGSDDKESACNSGDLGSIPGLGRSPEGGHGIPVRYSCLENPVDRGAWWATVHAVTDSRTPLSDWAQCCARQRKSQDGRGLLHEAPFWMPYF